MESLFYLLLTIQIIAINAGQNDKNLNSTEEFVLLNDIEFPCLRPCTANSLPMVCRYTFVIEWYQTLSRACYDCPHNLTDCFRPDCIPADGITRPVVVVNRKLPGPSFQLCKGDEVIINVENHLANDETTIHWHGHHQRGTPYMDGVPHVTQCPIPSGSTFQYNFRANHAGTHFWHSHSGFQRGDGAFGSMIIRVPKEENPHASLYDFDLPSHVIIVLDWTHEPGTTKFTNHYHSNGTNRPDTLLVNGLGYFESSNETKNVPASRFTVQQGFRYRFRVISAEFLNCPIEISVANHTLTMISSDGSDFEPVEVESFVTYAGERFDFILTADQEIDNYWMFFKGLIDCDELHGSSHQVAVLHYDGANSIAYPAGVPDYENSHKEGIQLNALNEGTTNDMSINIVELNSTEENDISLKENADYQFYISYDFYNITNPHFYSKGLYEYDKGHPKFFLTTPQLNHISMKLQSFPLLSGRNMIKPGMFCNESTVENCKTDFCQCTHILQVTLGSVVELILIDKGRRFDANHPFHLHGNNFRVVGMERINSSVTPEEIQELDKAGLIDRKLDKAPLKDTVTVPDGGYTILRFHANNPGYWLFHCHIDFHVEVGMSLVFKIGEHSDFPPVPPNFPTCGNWIPSEQKLEVTTKKTETTTLVLKQDPDECEEALKNSFIKRILNDLHIEDCNINNLGNRQENFLTIIFICSIILLINKYQ